MANPVDDQGQPEQARSVEILVPVADAELVRRVANALTNDDETARRLREALEEGTLDKVALKFKEWMAAFPDDNEPL